MQSIKRLTPLNAVSLVKRQLNALFVARGFTQQDQFGVGDDPATVWTRPIEFGLAIVSVVAWSSPGPGYRWTLIQLRFGFRDSDLGPVFYSDWSEHPLSVPDYGTSMDVVRRTVSRTPMQRHREGLEAGLYDGSSPAEIEISLSKLEADLNEVVFPYFARFRTRQSILGYLHECQQKRSEPVFFPSLELKRLAFEAMYGDRQAAMKAMKSRAASLRRWRRFYRWIGLDRTREEQDSIKWLDRMPIFLSKWAETTVITPAGESASPARPRCPTAPPP